MPGFLMSIVPPVLANHLYCQFVVPAAGCHVVPPSNETSTPATMPPPASVAVPVIVTVLPHRIDALARGEVIVDVGGVVSVEALAATKPGCLVAGWMPMTATQLTIATWIRTTAGVVPPT